MMTGARVLGGSGVATEHAATGGRVVITGCIAPERIVPGSCISGAGCVAEERLKTVGRVVVAARDTKECASTLSGIFVGVASVRCWRHRLNHLRKRK